MANKIILCQTGARHRYLIPKVLEDDGLLYRLYTDSTAYSLLGRIASFINKSWKCPLVIQRLSKRIPPIAKEKLYSLARTEWVVMLHDDDMLYPDFMKIMTRTVESDKDASCFYSCYNTFHGEGSEHTSREKHDVRVMTLREADYLTGCHLHAPLGMTLKREVVFKMGGFNPNYYPSLDFQFHVKLAHYHVVRWLRDYPIASYRWLTNASGKLETLYGWVEKDEAIKWMAFRNTNTHIPEWAYCKYLEYFRYLYMQNWFKSFNGKKEELKKPSVFSHIVYLILKFRLGLPKKLRKHYTIKL